MEEERFCETSERQTATWCWYAKERHYLINNLHKNVNTYIKVVIEVRIMSLIRMS